MTAERRLARVEASLTPTELVLRWLDEAHAFGDLESCVRALLAQDEPEAPLDRLAREANASVRASHRGRQREEVQPAVRAALRETVFRFELVMRINVVAREILDREVLIDAALAAQIGLLAGASPAARRGDRSHPERFAECRDLLAFRLSELRAAQEARASVESRYLASHTALFPATVSAWEEQIERSKTFAALACRLAELDGVPPAAPADPEGAAIRAAELMADLVEPAKATALEKIGEGDRALSIASAWLRERLGSVASVSELPKGAMGSVARR